MTDPLTIPNPPRGMLRRGSPVADWGGAVVVMADEHCHEDYSPGGEDR